MIQSFWKPAKGSAFLQRKARRQSVVSQEAAAKALVRRQDGRCRWPHCSYCRSLKPRLEVAHVVRAKGMGGDHGTVSQPGDLMLLCFLSHADQEQHTKRIVPLTPLGTRGSCEFWQFDGAWHLVARELAPFRYERGPYKRKEVGV